MSLAAASGGSRARPPARQGWGGPLSSHREALTASLGAGEGSSQQGPAQAGSKGEEPSRAAREQHRALQGGPASPPSSLCLQAQAGGHVEWGRCGKQEAPRSPLLRPSAGPLGGPRWPTGPAPHLTPDPRAVTSGTPSLSARPAPGPHRPLGSKSPVVPSERGWHHREAHRGSPGTAKKALAGVRPSFHLASHRKRKCLHPGQKPAGLPERVVPGEAPGLGETS